MGINLYKKKTINNQPVLEELLSKSTDTVDNKPLVYDSTTDNVKSADNLNVNSVTASCFHGPLDGTAKNATCFNEKTYAEACADILSGCAADSNKLNGKTYAEVCSDILSGCAADSNKLNGKTYTEVCSDILSGTAANATCFAGKTCTEWKDIIKTTCVDNAALATNATCFNGCTYSEACIDIRNGLATQDCADAIQNCADFIQSCVSAIESKIPAQASASNQLADKDFVNSSITTNTANFRGTYACVDELPTTGNTNNDYAFICSLNTTTGNYIYDRYKWVASDSCWVCEYELNTTGFTAEQLASINSGITSNLVSKITDVYDNTVTVCMNGECKGSFNLNQNTDVCIDLGDTIRNACNANYATTAAQASEATNATCFNGCTYACAKEDFRNGMAAAISIGDSCPYQADGNRVVHIPAYPPDLSSCDGLDCTGTVTQVKVGETAYDPVSGVVCLPEYPTIPTTVCTSECANTVKRNVANSGSCYLALFDGNTAINNAGLYVSNSKAITYTPATGCLSTCYVRGISGLIAGNPIGCTSSVLGQSGTNVSSGLLNLYTTNPSIGFHVCNAAVTSHSITGTREALIVCASNGTGCIASTQCAYFYFCSNGTFKATCFNGTATNSTCFGGCTYACAKADIRNYTPDLATCATNAGNSTCFGGCTYACAKADIRNYTPSLATNATCFGGCTYAQAYTNIRSGLISDIGVNVYCGTTCKCTLCKASSLCLSANAFNANATISTTTYPGACCTGTSNYVVTTMVCCAKQVCRIASGSTTYHLALFSGCTALSSAGLYASSVCPITYTTSDGTLQTCCVVASDRIKIGDSSACTSTQAGKNGINISKGIMEFYRDVPSLNFHSYNYVYSTHWIEARPGHFYFYVDNGTGCTACTQHAIFCFCSNGTLTATCFCGTASNATCFGGCTYASAKTDIRNYTPSLATNATCFGGCTYAQACTNIRSGLISDIGVAVYCGTTCKCTLCKASSLCLSANAFNANATISTSTYPGACKTGTVTSVNVSVNGCSGTAVTTSGTVTLTNVPTCRIYKTMATASCNRNVLLGEVTEAAGYGCVYVGNCCKLTFNPATGVLTAKCFCGSVTASGQIDCAKAIKRYQATTGTCHIALFNGTTAVDNACAYVSSGCPLTYNPATGELSTKGGAIFGYDVKGYCNGTITDACRTWRIGDNGLAQFRIAYVSGALSLGAQCDICIRDYCNNNFICGRCNTLTMGYNSDDFNEDFNYFRITVGLANHMCPGTNCGNSVVVGYSNNVCWPSDSNLSFIYGSYNTTNDGGLAVGGWNTACCGCAVAIGWDNLAGECGIAIGEGVCAIGLESIAIGCNAQANCIYSIAIGTESIANGIDRIAIGRYSATNTYGTACVNSNIKKGPLREITVTWCDSTLKCDIWKAIACNLDLRRNGKNSITTSGCTYLSATGYIGSNKIPLYACNYNYNSSLATMCSVVVRDSDGCDIMTISATCTAAATDANGGGFLTITGWAR